MARTKVGSTTRGSGSGEEIVLTKQELLDCLTGIGEYLDVVKRAVEACDCKEFPVTLPGGTRPGQMVRCRDREACS